MSKVLEGIGKENLKVILSENSPHPELKKKIFKLFQKKPILWYQYRWGGNPSHFRHTDYEEYEDHKWDGTPEGLKEAWDCVSRQQWVGLESCTGAGKTFLAAMMTFWFLDCFPHALVITTSTKFTQLKRTLWKEIDSNFDRFKELHPTAAKTSNPLEIRFSYPIYDEDGNKEAKADKRLAFGSTEQVGKDEDVAQGAAGMHSVNMLILVDEASGVEPAIIRAYKGTCSDDNNVVVLLGNPKSQIDALHQFCVTDKVKHIRLSAYDHPNIVCKRKIISGAVQPIRIERALSDLGSVEHPEYLALIRGISPEETQNSIIKISQVKACANIQEHEAIGVEEGYIGIDVANSKDGDKASVVSGKGNEFDYVKEFQCPDGSAIAWNLLHDTDSAEFGEFLNKYKDGIDRDYELPYLDDINIDPQLHENSIGVDATGVGAGTVNKFSEEGIDAYSFFAGGSPIKELYELDDDGNPIYTFNNLRSQSIYLLVKDLKEQNITLKVGPDNITQSQLQQLAIELAAMKRNPSNLVRHWQLESKEYTKRRLSRRSPNMADAFAIANLMRILKQKEIYFGSVKNYIGIHI